MLIKRIIKAILVFLHIMFGLLLLLLTGALWNPHTRLVKNTVQWWLVTVIKLLGVRVVIEGTPPTPNATKKYAQGSANIGHIFIGNHVSWLDIPLIGSLVQANFLSKNEVRHWPLIGKLATGAGTLFIKRGSGDGNKIAKQIADRTEAGHSVLFFPEGTSTDGSTIKPFYPKLFKACYDTEAEFYPVLIEYEVAGVVGNPIAFIGDDDFAQHLWHILGLKNITARVQFLPPRSFVPDSLDSQVQALHSDMCKALAA